jgi:hypothetical protein
MPKTLSPNTARTVAPLALLRGLRARRAVLAELRRLDPERDDHRIVQLLFGSILGDPFFVSLLFTVGAWRTVAMPPMSTILFRNGRADTMRYTRRRVDDTLLFLGFIMRDGYTTESAGANIDRVASIHSPFRIRSHDFRYFLAILCFDPIRLSEHLGVKALTDSEARAVFLFWRNVGRRWGLDVPEEQSEFRAWMQEYERQEFRYNPEGVALVRVTADDWVSRYFPRPAHRIGHAMLRAVCDQPLLDALGLPPASPVMRTLTVAVTRAYLRWRRVVPASLDRDLLLAPWSRPYDGEPDPARVGPAWSYRLNPKARSRPPAPEQPGTAEGTSFPLDLESGDPAMV